ncbi:MAG: DUF1214 domain-containing protein [Caulobacterales bacterium]
MAPDSETIQSAAAVSGRLSRAWDGYLKALKDMQLAFDRSDQFKLAPDQKGMAYRQLMEAQAMAYNYAVGPRTAHPRVFRNTIWQTEFYSIGGNGPDFDYRLSFIEGGHDYRLWGKINDCTSLFCQLNSALPGSEGSRVLKSYEFHEFELGPDKSFEIIVSARPHKGNWIELAPDADYQWLMFRPAIETWESKSAEIHIERISPLDPMAAETDEYSEEAVARRIEAATAFFKYILTDWAMGYVPLVLRGAGETNKFFTFSVEDAGEMGSPVAQYLQCVFEVDDDEALILEFDEEPKAAYWSLQLYDVWQHALAFRTRQSTLNGTQMAKDADNAVRVVLSRRDPGVANWLDNAGYRMGEVTWRNYKATSNVNHRIRRVKFDDLDRHLPAGTQRVTPRERAAELGRRRAAYLRRHGE